MKPIASDHFRSTLLRCFAIVFLAVLFFQPSASDAQTQKRNPKSQSDEVQSEGAQSEGVQSEGVQSGKKLPRSRTKGTSKGSNGRDENDAMANVNEGPSASTDDLKEDGNQTVERSKLTLTGQYSYLDMLVPGKIGGSVGFAPSGRTFYEVEFLGGSLSVPFIIKDLGSIEEKRVSFLLRHFGQRRSFNVFYGLSYMDLKIDVGNAILSRATGTPNIRLLGAESIGFILGLGNRWIMSNGLTFGVDWVSWAQPVFSLGREDAIRQYVTNAQDREALDLALRMSSYLPRFTLLKLQLGYSF